MSGRHRASDLWPQLDMVERAFIVVFCLDSDPSGLNLVLVRCCRDEVGQYWGQRIT